MAYSSHVITNLGLTVETLSSKVSAFAFSNANGLSFGFDGTVITGTVKTDYEVSGNYLTTAALSNHSHGVSFTSGSVGFQTLSFTNSNGFSFNSGTQGIFGSYTVPTLTAYVFSNSNGVSFGTNGSTVTATVATNYQSSGAYLTTAMLSNAATISNIKVSGGTLSANRSDITFADSNGISWGLNTNGAITGTVKTDYQSSGAYLTTAALSANTSNYAGINGAITGGSITVNTSGVSVNLPAYLTTAALSGNTSNYAGINGAITGGSLTVNTSGVSINLPAYLTTADLSANSSKYIQEWAFAGNNTAGTTSSAQGSRLYLSAGNSLTLSGNSNTIIFSVGAYLTTAALSQDSSKYQSTGAYLTTARASTDAIGLNTALTANGVAWTVNSSGLSLNVPAFLTTAALSGDSSLYRFTSANSQLQFTSANSNFVQQNAVFNGTNASGTIASNAISVSVAAAGGSTFSNYFEPFPLLDGTATSTLSLSNIGIQPFWLDDAISFGNINMVGNATVVPTSASNNWSVRLTNSSQGLIYSAQYGVTNSNFVDMFLFKRGTGGYSSELETFASTRNSFITYFNMTQSARASLTGTSGGNVSLSQNLSMSISYPFMTSGTMTSVNANTTFTTWGSGYTTWNSTASNSISTTMATSATTSLSIASTYPATVGWSGAKLINFNFGSSLTAGEYWLGINMNSSTSSSSGSGSTITGAAGTGASYTATYNASNFTSSQMLTYAGKTNSIANSLGSLGFITTNNMAPQFGLGSFSGTWDKGTTYVNNAGNPNGAIAFTQLRTGVSNFQSWFQFGSNRI